MWNFGRMKWSVAMSSQVFLIAVLSANVIQAITTWDEFKQVFKPKLSESEDEYRKSIFHENLEKIQKLNVSEQAKSFSVAVNKLAHLTDKERAQLRGLVVNNSTLALYKTVRPQTAKLSQPLQELVDYRNSPCMPPVKNQGFCGSCWAFVATAAMEYYHCKFNGKLELLSEQQLVDCDTESLGCNGGYWTWAWDYIKKAPGQCRFFTYPYISGVTGKPFIPEDLFGSPSRFSYYPKCRRSTCSVRAFIRSYQTVVGGAQAMAEIVANVGPIAVPIDASSFDFNFYSTGVYQNPDCGKDINHGLVIVGYGTTPDGIDYWIARNSWGKDWGENGYIRIHRGSNMCEIESFADYPVVY